MINLETAVHNDRKTCLAGKIGRLFIDDTLLHPDDPGADLDGILNNRQHLVGPAKYVNQVNRPADGNQIRIARQAKDAVLARIDGNNRAASCKQIPGHLVAGPMFFG